ncbi:MAG: 50S ribosomal protein L18 [Candidatus Paceibacteria bacterium]
MHTPTKITKRATRHNRIRARVTGTSARPRLAVFKSNTAIYAQLIDDTTGKTLAAADSRSHTGSLLTRAEAVGKEIAKKGGEVKITTAVFDRGGFRYQGAVAVLADAARAGGLAF